MSGEMSALKEVSIEDLLFRVPIEIENPLNRELVEGKVVLVLGGVGSIGSELCRQVLENGCKMVAVCFGNVLESNGSVTPLFKK